MEDMTGVVTLESFVPQYQNQSIYFTGDDMGSDRAMMVMLLYIVMAFLHLYLELRSAIRSEKKQELSVRFVHPGIQEVN